MVICRWSVPVVFLNVLNEIAALVLVSGADFYRYSKSVTDALALFFLRLHGQESSYAIFWGLWLFPFGMLVIDRFSSSRVWRFADDCRVRLSGEFLYLAGSARVRAFCRPGGAGPRGWGGADNLLALDLGCEGAAIRRHSLPVGECLDCVLARFSENH